MWIGVPTVHSIRDNSLFIQVVAVSHTTGGTVMTPPGAGETVIRNFDFFNPSLGTGEIIGLAWTAVPAPALIPTAVWTLSRTNPWRSCSLIVGPGTFIPDPEPVIGRPFLQVFL